VLSGWSVSATNAVDNSTPGIGRGIATSTVINQATGERTTGGYAISVTYNGEITGRQYLNGVFNAHVPDAHIIRIFRGSVPNFAATPRGVQDPDDSPFIICSDGDPVHMATGNFYLDYANFSLHGTQPLDFTRHYNSRDTRTGELGRGWRHNYMYSIEGGPCGIIIARLPDGSSIDFGWSSNNLLFPYSHTDKSLFRWGNFFYWKTGRKLGIGLTWPVD
jgi:hypothetical protein